MKNITIITAFFDIGRGSLKESSQVRSNNQYFEYFKFWCKIKNNLVVYTQSEYAYKVREIRKEFGLEDKTIVIEIDDIFEICGTLYERMYNISKREDFNQFRYYTNALSNRADYNYIMLMKYWCMKDAVDRSLTDEQVAWIDFGFNHGGKYFTESNEFDFEWKWTFEHKIQLFSLREVEEVSSINSLQMQFDTIMGPIIICPKDLCCDLWNLVKNAMEALLMLDCIDDDQQLLLMAYKHKPELFAVNRSTWFEPLKLYGGEHLTIRENTGVMERKTSKILALKIFIKNLFFKENKNFDDPNYKFANRLYETVKKYY